MPQAKKRAAHRVGTVEAAVSRNLIHRVVAFFQPAAGDLHADSRDKTSGRGAGLVREGACKMPWTHGRTIGKRGDREVFGSVFEDPGSEVPDPPSVACL